MLRKSRVVGEDDDDGGLWDEDVDAASLPGMCGALSYLYRSSMCGALSYLYRSSCMCGALSYLYRYVWGLKLSL
jgi:hypothetical protein